MVKMSHQIELTQRDKRNIGVNVPVAFVDERMNSVTFWSKMTPQPFHSTSVCSLKNKNSMRLIFNLSDHGEKT